MTALPLALALWFTGFAGLAAAMPRHWRQLAVSIRQPTMRLRVAATAAMIGAVLVCGTVWNPARAVPAALGLASIAAIAVSLTLTFLPRALLPLAVLLPLVAGACLA